MRLGVIYKLSVTKTKYFLYGSSINLKGRIAVYKEKLRKNKYSNRMLQFLFNKYGEESLKFEIVQENIPEDILRIVEDIWIGANCSKFKDKKGGLNVRGAMSPEFTESTKKKISISRKGKCVGKENPFYGKKHTEEFKKRQSERMKGVSATHAFKQVLQYDLEGNFIKLWESITEASIKCNINLKSISNACNQITNYSSGYYWLKYKKDTEILNYISFPPHRGKSVYQLDLNDNMVKEWKTIKELLNTTKWNKNIIKKCIRGEKESAYGFKWKLKKYEDFKK